MQVNMENSNAKKRRLDSTKEEPLAIDNQLLDRGNSSSSNTNNSSSDQTSGRSGSNSANLRRTSVSANQYENQYGTTTTTGNITSTTTHVSTVSTNGGGPVSLNQYQDTDDEQLVQRLRENKKSVMDNGEQSEGRGDEWRRVKRDNHKEVERRRRENINKGIDDLAKIVPNCDKHKGQILKKAVDYINQLLAEAKKNREEYAYGEMLLKQTLSEFTSRNKALQTELEQAWREAEHWKKRTAALEDPSSSS